MMAPFRWPSIAYDLDLAREVACCRPEKPADWDTIAQKLSAAFTTENKSVELKGRGCRERLERLLAKYKEEDARSLKRSGTEEEYLEIHQLLEDIITYRRDMKETRAREKELKDSKVEDGKRKAEEIRRAAMEGMTKQKSLSTSSSSDSTDSEDEAFQPAKKAKDSKPKRQRASKLSVMEVMAEKYDRRAELKEKELEIRKMELELQTKRHEIDTEERKQRLEVEMAERKAMLQLLLNNH